MPSRDTAVRVDRSGGIWLSLALLLVLLGASTGCDITDFSGPPFALPGTTVTFTVDIQSVGSYGSPFDLHVLLRVPTMFALQSSSYSGTVQSTPVSGTPTVSTSDPSTGCDFASFVGSPGAGYQDIWFSESFAGSDGPTDGGTLTVEFAVHPNAAFAHHQLLAATAIDDPITPENGLCIDTATRNVTVVAGTVPAVESWGLVGLAVGLAGAAGAGRRLRA